MARFSCNVFFLLLLVCSVTLMVVPESYAQELCRENVPGDGTCDATVCHNKCLTVNPKAAGNCLDALTRRFCLCTWAC
ncbi:hypothetical protein HS088_TW12G00096 [Tripterygium wilfordii]|uniref:Defensin-like protein n=1 Tax=Tripterygium wilfordii TaxID=458696 RepID=A0A7J7CXS9_TRIWF|nr:putative defensin-like protein 119 [Tripterygium wilfordii]KAF5738901.1 hypothetical protein HS088_TW12G00096 [Tripterygium wilfordii]